MGLLREKEPPIFLEHLIPTLPLVPSASQSQCGFGLNFQEFESSILEPLLSLDRELSSFRFCKHTRLGGICLGSPIQLWPQANYGYVEWLDRVAAVKASRWKEIVIHNIIMLSRSVLL